MNHRDEQDAGPSAETLAFEAALGSLAAFIATGPAPDRVIQAIGAMIAGWADEPEMSEDVMQLRVERLWDSFSRDASDLQAQLADAEDAETPELGRGRRVLAALDAAVMVLASVQR
ncbi:MAG: hypothetical protein ACRYGM_28180 [Janthinobacterium lividum]